VCRPIVNAARSRWHVHAKIVDGAAVRERERDGRIMVNTEHDCRPGTDEDQREGANEHGGQGPGRTRLLFQSLTIISKHGPATGYPPSGPICRPYPPKITRLALRYSAVHLLPVNLRKSL
jgi:hypothetical protein